MRFPRSRPIEKAKSHYHRREGHATIESLTEAYKDKIVDAKRKAVEPLPPPPPSPSRSTQESSFAASSSKSPVSSNGGSSTASATPGIRPLSVYLNLEKIASLPNKEIEYIWRLRHASDPLSLCAVIPVETYNRIYQNAKKHPQFILPLPQPAAAVDGAPQAGNTTETSGESQNHTAADIHFLQWGFYPPSIPPVPGSPTANTHTSTVLFTHLALFKSHGAFAQPHTTITHHLDLADSHGLVLLNGAVVKDRGVSVEEARWLLMCLQKFYDFEGQGDEVARRKRRGLLERFSRGDHEGFRLGELVDEAERTS